MLMLHHGELDSSARYRMYPWLPFLRARGVMCDERPRRAWRYPPHSGGPLGRAGGYLRVIETLGDVMAVGRYDLVFTQGFLFPHRVDELDLLLRRSRRLILDITDALFCRPHDDRPIYERRLRRLCGMADVVLVANRFLSDWVGLPDRTLVVPTVVDFDRIPPKTLDPAKKKVTIGWLGQVFQLSYLKPLFPVLRELAKDPRVEVIFHTSSIAQTPELTEMGVKVIPFDAEHEAEVIGSVDIGLMPMPNTLYNLGKCPLKVIQYMAFGATVVCSPVGSNTEMVQDGVQGFFADTPAEWCDRLRWLIDHPEERLAMGRAGQRRAADHYSVRAHAARVVDAMIGAEKTA